MSNNQFPFFVGAKLRFVGDIGQLLLPNEIKDDLMKGLVLEIVGISENGNPRFVHQLGHDVTNPLYWCLIDEEAKHFELVNPEQVATTPLKVKDLHPKDIALVQAMHIIHRTQQRMSNGCSVDEAGVGHAYLVGNFLERSVEAVKALQGYGEDLMQDLTINYNLKGEKHA